MKSSILHNALENLDQDIFELEIENERLKAKVQELHKQICSNIDKQLKEGQNIMSQTFLAILDIPEISSLGTVGVTVVAKIRDMKTIEEVHNYIDKIYKIK